MRRAHRLLAPALAALILLLTPSMALADADLIEARPEAGAVVTELTDVVLLFDELLDPGRSSVEVRVAGSVVARGGVDPVDAAVLRADIEEARPGTYEVRYTVASGDGHLVRDTFTLVLEPAPTPSPTPTPRPLASPQATLGPTTAATQPASPVPAASPDPGGEAAGSSDVLLPILAAVAIVGGLAVHLSRRRIT